MFEELESISHSPLTPTLCSENYKELTSRCHLGGDYYLQCLTVAPSTVNSDRKCWHGEEGIWF